MTQAYSIGTPGQSWGDKEKALWRQNQQIKRSYHDEVVTKVNALSSDFEVVQYGKLDYFEGQYPLFALKSQPWCDAKPTVLVTGGVHGYETSGVQGALRFAATQAKQYAKYFNLLIAPCVSPWGYETINRWNPLALDPNRSFYPNSPAGESAALMSLVANSTGTLIAHIDLHETTETDNSEFRPALAARDGTEHSNWDIPDGFYLVGDSENPCDAMQQAIIEAVAKVTHIAPADGQGRLIGAPTSQFGVINYPTKSLGLCTGFSDARFNTTTEVYPDSPQVDAENCILAQVEAVTSALDFILNQLKTGDE